MFSRLLSTTDARERGYDSSTGQLRGILRGVLRWWWAHLASRQNSIGAGVWDEFAAAHVSIWCRNQLGGTCSKRTEWYSCLEGTHEDNVRRVSEIWFNSRSGQWRHFGSRLITSEGFWNWIPHSSSSTSWTWSQGYIQGLMTSSLAVVLLTCAPADSLNSATAFFWSLLTATSRCRQPSCLSSSLDGSCVLSERNWKRRTGSTWTTCEALCWIEDVILFCLSRRKWKNEEQFDMETAHCRLLEVLEMNATECWRSCCDLKPFPWRHSDKRGLRGGVQWQYLEIATLWDCNAVDWKYHGIAFDSAANIIFTKLSVWLMGVAITSGL